MAKKGDDVVQMNYQAIERGANEVVEVPVPAEWKDCKDEVLGEQAVSGKPEVLDFVNNIQKPINACQGDKLPVSTFIECYWMVHFHREQQLMKSVVLQ